MALTPQHTTQTIFDFNKSVSINNWFVVNDGVMGGVSSGIFFLNDDGQGVFSGKVSLENNGGFSSLRYAFQKMKVSKDSKVIIRLKGDGKNYQFRVKDKSSNFYSYIYTFQTSGDWEDIKIPLNEMYPSFRGRRLNYPNFSSESIEEITFLIGNKKNEKFELQLDTIILK